MAAKAMQELLKELPELGVEDGVDDGVERAVHVAQPRDDVHQTSGNVTRRAYGTGCVHHKEGSPAEEEAACMGTLREQRKVVSLQWSSGFPRRGHFRAEK